MRKLLLCSLLLCGCAIVESEQRSWLPPDASDVVMIGNGYSSFEWRGKYYLMHNYMRYSRSATESMVEISKEQHEHHQENR